MMLSTVSTGPGPGFGLEQTMRLEMRQEMDPVKKKVLIIDDDVSVIAMLSLLLMGEGLVISAAQDGKEGLKLAVEEQPNLVILDINMPGLNGFQVCELIKSRRGTRDIPVIFHSVNSRHADLERGKSLGAEDYLLKPVTPAVFLETVRKYL